MSSFFSNLGSKISSAYNAVKNTVNNIGNYLTANVVNSSNNLIQKNNNDAALYIAKQAVSKPAPSTPNIAGANSTPIPKGTSPSLSSSLSSLFTASNPSGTPNPFNSTPTSLKSGSIPVSYGGASGSWGVSNYSSSSYSPTASFSSASFSPQPVSQTISSGTLGAGTPSIVTPSAPSQANYGSTALSGNIKVGANPATGIIEQKPVFDASGNSVQNPAEKTTPGRKALDEYLSKLQKPPSEVDAYKRAQQEAGLQQAQIQRNNTRNAINAITTQMNTDLLQLRGTAAKEGVTEAVYGGQQSEITREATIKLLPLQAQLAVDQGNVELAQENTNTLYKMYSQDAKNSADFYNKQVESIYDFVKEEDKKVLEEKVFQKNFNADMIKTDSKNQSDIANELLASGNMVGYKAVTSVRPPINVNSPTFEEDYQNYKQDLAEAVARYGSSIGLQDRQIKNAQIQKLYSEAADKKSSNNAISRVSQVNPDSPTYIQDVIMASAGGAKLTGDQTKPISKGLTVVSQIDSLQATLANQNTDPIIGILRSGNPYDVQAQLIKAQLQALIPNLARGVYGEVGVLTDNDIANYRQTIGSLKTPKQTNDLLMSMTLKNIRNGIADQLEVAASAGRDVSGFNNLYSRLDNKINEIDSRLGISHQNNISNFSKADEDYVNSLFK